MKLILVVWKLTLTFCLAYSDHDFQPFQSASHYQSHKSSRGIKTISKSSSVTKIHSNEVEFKGGCKNMPPASMNVKIKCSMYSGCQASCIQDFQFPNGETQLFISCRDGEWQIEGTEWTTIPSCEPICFPPCINNGICIAPNQCNCPENYSGSQCQFHNKPCLNYPPMPINSRRQCNSKTCTISCLPGHQFSDGSQVANMICNEGIWSPAREDWKSVPDCEPICSPPCQNGGNCLSFNVCQCPQEFKGPQCQYRADVCNSKKLQFNGGYNCSSTIEGFECSLFCPEGIEFEFPPALVYTCRYETGLFVPIPIPQCVFGNAFVQKGNTFYNMYNSSFTLGGSYLEGQHLEGMGEYSFNSISSGFPNYQFPKPNPPPEKIINDSRIVFPNENQIETSGNFLTIENNEPVPGVCFTWGGTHFKTFDGKVFSFDSSCAHMLVRDAKDGTFSVIVKNSKECETDKQNCYRTVNIYLQEKEYILKRTGNGVPVFASSKKVYPLPTRLPGIRAEMSAHFLLVTIDSIDVIIKWDGQKLVQINVKENLWNRTEGLCGNLDGNIDNDFMTKSKQRANSIVTLATSWQVDNLQETCNKIPQEEHTCNDVDNEDSVGHQALKFCQKLLSDKRFKACQSKMDVLTLLDACRWDYCTCQDSPEKCACQTLNVYVRECSHKGITALANWRDKNFCHMECEGNRVYMPCAPPEGQEVCGDVHEKNTNSENCEEGCYCPEGTVMHNSECIVKEKCPCKLRGKEFEPGSSVPKDCNTCTCSNGIWVCTQVDCGARCSALGDPHYITFDGKRYNFMGRCSYFLVKHDNFSIEAENVPCSGAISQAMNFPPSISSGLPSCTKTVTIRISGQTIKLKQNHEVVVNGKEITKIPYKIANSNIRSVSSIFLLVELPNKVEIWWDGLTRVYVDVPASFKGKTEGLCGTFTNTQKDDFLTPEGDVEKLPEAFANKWKTTEKCNDVPEKILAHPCVSNVQNKEMAEKHCGVIKSKQFYDCHWYVDPEPFYQDCLYDVCSCENKLSKCLCPMISAYAQECAMKGIKVNWRNDVRECGIHCPGGQEYQVCGNSCTRTCLEVALNPDCDRVCVEGCNCPTGQALDEYGECIPIAQCKCQYEGLEFLPGYKEVRPASKGLQLCTCLNAQWICRLATDEESKQFPRASDLKTMCNTSKNMEFTTCEPEEPITCKNMHSLDLFSSSVCHPGCQCKDGFVLDSSNNECVKPEHCPCHHGGRSYGENFVVQSDCNICTCQGGKWKCTERQCSAECSSWGDSHFKTFDGKMYDYQGQCDYILAKGSLGPDESFEVSIQSVPCGSLGVSCSKSVTIKVGEGSQHQKITLSRDKKVPIETTMERLTLRQKGLFVIVEAIELGLVIYWDKGTRVYVKVDPRWKNKVRGLCGNYNDNENDDFQTPSGGITEVSAQIFGDSWRLQSYCSKAVELLDTCEQRPDRKIWAVKKCGVLKSPLFAPCHSEVPIDDYINRCIFDTCACDQGGDCECLCTALAAYAQECNNKGVPIKWRSQELCPMQCDERCSEYSPCISTCPVETCDNFLIHSKLSKVCNELSCIEGCSTKPCPADHIYFNSSTLECVPKSICKPVCLEIDGVTYYEGDLLEEDECHRCFCSRGQRVCKGQPCTTATIPQVSVEVTKPPNEQRKCKSGWSNWVNQDKITQKNAKIDIDQKLNDVEPLPTSIIMNQLKGNVTCSENEIIDIECRTVKGHIHPKETGLDVECSLERGLVCKSNEIENPCEDFEIRVKCECEESTTLISSTPYTTPSLPKTVCDPDKPNQEHPTNCHLFYHCVTNTLGEIELVEKSCGSDTFYNPITQVCDWRSSVISIKPQCAEEISSVEITTTTEASSCPPGEKFDSCAINCNQLCLYYNYLVKQNGHCNKYEECVPGCVPEHKPISCPSGMLWSENQTCIMKHDCLCVSNQGKPVRPGIIVTESNCSSCQCLDNYYTCDHSACNTKEPLQKLNSTTATVPEKIKTSTSPSFSTFSEYVTLKTTVTPPVDCDENRFMNLIDGEIPLSDSAFSSSSEMSFFPAKYARLNNKANENKGGSWMPKISDENQYIQVDLGKQEPVYGVIMRGSQLYNNFVTSYKVAYSSEGNTFRFVTDKNNQPQIFRGPADNQKPSQQLFDVPVEAKIIKILPLTWNGAIAIRMELIGCKESVVSSSVQTSTELGKISTKQPNPVCTDFMGFDKDLMLQQQVMVSSSISNEHDKNKLKISGNSYWQPLTNSPSEWVEFDFLELRNLTGFVSKGGSNGWVTSFNVQFAKDDKIWNTILDDTRKYKIFLGNYDTDSEHVNYFDLPVQARFLKLMPLTWHKDIQLRVEIIGCFKKYPQVEITTLKTTTAVNENCEDCPGVLSSEMELGACRCKSGLFWDGENCVQKSQCPCMVGHISYAVGSVFEKEDCSQCICKLGGVELCTPKFCEKCEEGLRSVVTSTCGCICQPCPKGMTLCPSNNICIDSSLWCNGIEDCSDDELSCSSSVFTTPTYTTEATVGSTRITETHVKKCPTPSCPPGYKVKIKKTSISEQLHSHLSPMFSSYGRKAAKKRSYSSFKSYSKKGGVKSKHNSKIGKPIKSKQKQKESIKQEEAECPEFICESTKPPPKFINGTEEEYQCPPIICPSGYTPQYELEELKKPDFFCPKYECIPPPVQDSVCNVTGRTFITFDRTEYKYDICDHVLARDLDKDAWQIVLKKSCTTSCSRDLVIFYDNNIFVFHPDISIEFDNYKYSIDQVKKIGSKSQSSFTLSRLGDTLLFISNRYGFWVIWDKGADVKVGVSGKLLKKVDGLCGFFNYVQKDDKRKPDGTLARTTIEFGDSWGSQDRPPICETKACSLREQDNAWKMCQKVKEGSLSLCNKVLDVDAFISRCLETTCNCLEGAGEDKSKRNLCKCKALEAFVVDCLTVNDNLELSDWRMQQDCPAICDPPLVQYDCYKRRCEPSCESLSDPNSCPQLPHVCFPGCYCPPGFVRKGDDCILPTLCRDCECNVLPHLEYVGYDGHNVTVTGNCEYVMSRDVIEKEGNSRQFQISIENRPCIENLEKTCIGKVKIAHQDNHLVEVVKDNEQRKLKVILNSEDYNFNENVHDWLEIKEDPTKHLRIALVNEQVEISVYFPSLGVSIKTPSMKYGGKMEGLCGNCDGNVENDMILPNKTIASNPEEFALNWLSNGQSQDQCFDKPKEICVPLPIENDPCLILTDSDIFGQCHLLLDPMIYIDWCKKDTCNKKAEQSCGALSAYAQECAQLGLCIEWRNELCPPEKCLPGFEYKPCGPECVRLCEDIKENRNCSKKSLPVEGCFCPKGKALLGDSCVEENLCKICDDEGHHPGDVWKKDNCTTCTCIDTNIKCETQTCPSIETVCEQGYTAIKVQSDSEECCSKYICAPTTPNFSCEPPQKLLCANDQTMKLITNSNGCQQFICECKPSELCESVNLTSTEPGIEIILNTSGCCPIGEKICKVDRCPSPPECPKFYSTQKITVDGHCCPTYDCTAPTDKCIVDLKYTYANEGGERLRNEYEKQQVLKMVNESWIDGPCRSCKCIPDSSYKPTSECILSECSSLEDSPDFSSYVLETMPLEDHCCPALIRIACKHADKVYQPGEEWPASENDVCSILKCVNTNNNIQIEKHVVSCDTNCEIGWEYQTPDPESKQCCGSCVPAACVVDGTVRYIGEEWTSDDYCKKYTCSKENDSIQIQSTVTNCSQISEDLLKEFVYEWTEVSGECCPKSKIIGCKVAEKEYKIGETWDSPDGNKCKKYTCIMNDFGEIIKQEIIESCNKNCSNGWEYIETETSCCGTCEQVACLVNETLFYPNETWQDGPCKDCQCVLSESNKPSQECISAKCIALENSPDYTDYVLEAVNIPDKCCPDITRTACKHEGKVYQPGEKWPIAEGDYCNLLECVKTDGIIHKEKQVISCKNECDFGWEYQAPNIESKKCCGSCIPVSCVVEGNKWNIGEEWTSDDYCTKFKCLNINGSLQVQATAVNCPGIPEEYLKEYVYESNPVEGECCKKHKIVGCKMNDEEYKIGETWLSPDGDKCKTYSCIENSMGEVIKQESIEKCNRNCSKGWEYKDSSSSCCGKCEPVACLFNNTLKYPNDMWKSEDGCTTFTCELIEGQMSISSSQESCPNIGDCPPESIYVKNCCKHCNLTTGVSQVLCTPQAIKPIETVGIVKVVRHQHGECVNKDEVQNFTECIGSCHSSTTFNPKTGAHDSVCSCCQATKYEQLSIKLNCEDGYVYTKLIAVPSQCGCVGCAAESFTKKGRRKTV